MGKTERIMNYIIPAIFCLSLSCTAWREIESTCKSVITNETGRIVHQAEIFNVPFHRKE